MTLRLRRKRDGMKLNEHIQPTAEFVFLMNTFSFELANFDTYIPQRRCIPHVCALIARVLTECGSRVFQ